MPGATISRRRSTCVSRGAATKLISPRSALSFPSGATAVPPGEFDGLSSLTLPILLGWGEQERYNPVELGPQIAAAMPPQTRYRVFAGAGHNIPHDAPADVADAIAALAKR